MKKLICFMIVLLILPTAVLAGSVPEDLLSAEEAKLFIGTVEGYTTSETPNSPYVSIDTVTVLPTEKIKGDVTVGIPETYNRCDSILTLQTDMEYLFAYLDENNFYIYEIEERNGDKISLKDSSFPMVKRLENYLNDGSFAETESERLASASLIASAEKPKPDTNFGWWIAGGTVIICAAVIIVYEIIKKK